MASDCFFSSFDASHYTFVINIVRSVGCATMMLSKKKGAAHFSASATTSPGAKPQRARGPPSRMSRRLGACPAGLTEKKCCRKQLACVRWKCNMRWHSLCVAHSGIPHDTNIEACQNAIWHEMPRKWWCAKYELQNKGVMLQCCVCKQNTQLHC